MNHFRMGLSSYKQNEVIDLAAQGAKFDTGMVTDGGGHLSKNKWAWQSRGKRNDRRRWVWVSVMPVNTAAVRDNFLKMPKGHHRALAFGSWSFVACQATCHDKSIKQGSDLVTNVQNFMDTFVFEGKEVTNVGIK